MKKTLTLLSAAYALTVFSQVSTSTISPQVETAGEKISRNRVFHANQPQGNNSIQPESVAAQNTIIWSEDFANGIPSTWNQNGTPTAAQWEYRGPNTTPSNAVGSRGGYAGTATLNSTSSSNGFVIFDSDYLDNGGTAGAFGMGSAPTPHYGRLETDTIDLSSYQNVEIKFESYVRRFQAEFKIAFSKDGGATWPDTITIWDNSNLSVNASNTNSEVIAKNISSIVGGQSQVVIQFLFDGSTNGDGYYYWMLDDVELRVAPEHRLNFTSTTNDLAQNIVYNNDPAYPGYGIMHQDQIVPMQFMANLVNTGVQAQSNVQLQVEIYDTLSNTLVTTLQSTGSCANLQPGDTCFYDSLTTANWTPPNGKAAYSLVFKGVSDSIPAASTVAEVAIPQYVDDALYSFDRGVLSNVTSSSLLAVAKKFNLSNPDPDSASLNQVYIDGVEIYISSQSDSTADIEIAVYDTAGFPNNSPTLIASKLYTLNGSHLGRTSFFSLENITPTDTTPLSISTDAYYVQISFFPNATNGSVRIGNDATFNQAGANSMMLFNDGNWYNRFSNSRSFASPWLRLRMFHDGNCTVTSQVNQQQCGGSYTSPGGNTYSASGTYTELIPSTTGACDTMLVINLTIGNHSVDSIAPVLCGANYTSPAGNVYTQSGNYQDTLTTAAGCDSIINIQLSLNTTLRDTINPVVVCAASYLSPSGMYTYTSSGTYSDTLAGRGGCDSVVQVNLTLTSPSTNTLNLNLCAKSYTSPTGKVLSQSGNYTDTLVNAQGCDSLININLILLPLPDTSVSRVGDTLISNQGNGVYQWFDCSNGFTALAGETNRSLALTSPGNYAVVVNNGTCSDTSSCINVEGIGLAQFLQQNAAVYPNPTAGKISIDLKTMHHQIAVHVYSTDGKLVLKDFIQSAKSFQLEIPGPKGTYLVRLITGKGERASFNITKTE